MAEVVVEDERADAERRRGLGRHGERDHGRPLVAEVVGNVEGGVARDPPSCGPAPAMQQGMPRLRGLEREPEGGHGRRSYGVNLFR